MTRLIEDYALLGTCRRLRSCAADGSIDWCCFPRFDSAACFAALLGHREHGRWLVAPVGRRRRHPALPRRHARARDGVRRRTTARVRVIDCMPPRGDAPDIVRIVEGLEGTVPDVVGARDPVRLRQGRSLGPARSTPPASRLAGPDALCFRTPARDARRGSDHGRRVHRLEGERVPFVLTWFPSHSRLPAPFDAERRARRRGRVLAATGRRAARTTARTARRSSARSSCSRR